MYVIVNWKVLKNNEREQSKGDWIHVVSIQRCKLKFYNRVVRLGINKSLMPKLRQAGGKRVSCVKFEGRISQTGSLARTRLYGRKVPDQASVYQEIIY